MDFGDNRKYGTAFSRLFNCSDKCLTIALEDCGKENSLFAFALDRCDFEENYINLIKNGITRFEAKYKVPLTEQLTVILLDIFPSLLQIYSSTTIKNIQS